LKRKPPVDFAKHGAVSLPIRYSPVKALVQNPKVPHVKGTPLTLIERKYESFVVDARVVGCGRIRATTIEEA
jgi:hypothetical protein